MNVGDWILFRDMGAYTMAAASCFNGMPKPKCYYILSEQDWYIHIYRLINQLACWSSGYIHSTVILLT